jgi:hypothetical protein
MSRSRFAGFIAAACAATSLIGAAPAHAGPGDPVDCYKGLPPSGDPAQTIVTIDGLDVTVNPNGTVDTDGTTAYALAVVNAVRAYAFCVEGDTIDPVYCPVGATWLPTKYLYQDSSGTVRVEGNELAADVSSCL